MLPSQYLALDRYEKAFIVAAVRIKQENDEKEAKKIKKANKK